MSASALDIVFVNSQYIKFLIRETHGAIELVFLLFFPFQIFLMQRLICYPSLHLQVCDELGTNLGRVFIPSDQCIRTYVNGLMK